MKLEWFCLLIGLGGCGVDDSSVSSTTQAIDRPDVLARFRMTGAGAAVVASTNGAPWHIQYLAVDRYVTDVSPPPLHVSFGGGHQDPESLHLGPYGYYYAAGYSDYAYGLLPNGDGQVTSTHARLLANVPPNSDSFYSERCYYDHRTAYRECISLEGAPIDIAWESTGELEVNNGIQEFDMGNIVLRLAGRYTFTLAHASGTLLGEPIRSEIYSYITRDAGNGVWIEATPQ